MLLPIAKADMGGECKVAEFPRLGWATGNQRASNDQGPTNLSPPLTAAPSMFRLWRRAGAVASFGGSESFGERMDVVPGDFPLPVIVEHRCDGLSALAAV